MHIIMNISNGFIVECQNKLVFECACAFKMNQGFMYRM